MKTQRLSLCPEYFGSSHKTPLGFQPGPTAAPEKPHAADQVAEWDSEKPGYPRVSGHRVSPGEGPGILPSHSLHGWSSRCFPLQLGENLRLESKPCCYSHCTVFQVIFSTTHPNQFHRQRLRSYILISGHNWH